MKQEKHHCKSLPDSKSPLVGLGQENHDGNFGARHHQDRTFGGFGVGFGFRVHVLFTGLAVRTPRSMEQAESAFPAKEP